MSRVSDVEELSLPCLSLGEMERWNRLHVPRAPLAIGNWSIRFGAKGTPIEPKQLRVSLPWGNAVLCCPAALLDAIADSLQPGLHASDVAPDPARIAAGAGFRAQHPGLESRLEFRHRHARRFCNRGVWAARHVIDRRGFRAILACPHQRQAGRARGSLPALAANHKSACGTASPSRVASRGLRV